MHETGMDRRTWIGSLFAGIAGIVGSQLANANPGGLTPPSNSTHSVPMVGDEHSVAGHCLPDRFAYQWQSMWTSWNEGDPLSLVHYNFRRIPSEKIVVAWDGRVGVLSPKGEYVCERGPVNWLPAPYSGNPLDANSVLVILDGEVIFGKRPSLSPTRDEKGRHVCCDFSRDWKSGLLTNQDLERIFGVTFVNPDPKVLACSGLTYGI